MLKRKVLPLCLLTVMMFTAACGNSGAVNEPADTVENSDNAKSEESSTDKKESTDSVNEAANNTEETSDNASEDSGDAASSDYTITDDIIGDWELVYTLNHMDYNKGEQYEYISMAQDPDSPQSRLVITKSDDKYIANYKYDFYESTVRFYGNELVYKNKPVYDGFLYSNWSYEFSDPFDDGGAKKRLTSAENDYLVVAEEYTDDSDPEYYYHSLTRYYYLKSDNEKLKDPDNLRYFNTVTVSNVTDLINKIANNTKIILEPGTYNFSDITPGDIDNNKIEYIYDTLTIKDVSNLCLEAKSGGEVLLCINSEIDPVVSFSGGENIRLDGLVAGHNVQKGYCSGSVLSFEGTSRIRINDCHLYGCGTYGITGNSVYDMEVTDSEIYECTYGLLDFTYAGTISFKNCVFRDSEDMSMINVYSGSFITFEDCEFNNNVIYSDYNNYFVYMNEYDDVNFKNCKFNNNKYNEFSNLSVNLENCTFDDSGLIDGKAINEALVTGKNDILDLYEKAKAKQDEISAKIRGDDESTPQDQSTLNNLAYQEFEMWDALINKVWSYLGSTLDESDMASLRDEQNSWIKNKEAAVKDAASPWEGGTMQPLIEYGTGSDWTQKRVEYLIEKYIK